MTAIYAFFPSLWSMSEWDELLDNLDKIRATEPKKLDKFLTLIINIYLTAKIKGGSYIFCKHLFYCKLGSTVLTRLYPTCCFYSYFGA